MGKVVNYIKGCDKYNSETVRQLDNVLADQMLAAGLVPRVYNPKSVLSGWFIPRTNKTGRYVTVSAFGIVWMDSDGDHFPSQVEMGGSREIVETFYASVNGRFSEVRVLISIDKHGE